MSLALLYVRVSSKEQEEEGCSLDAQEKLGYDYAKRNHLKITKVYKVAESAWKKDRVAFNQMVEYAKKHSEIGHIIFDVPDRMTRNDFDKLKIYSLVKEFDKTIHFSRSNRKWNRESRSEDEFMLDIEVANAKKQSNDISLKAKMGMQERAEQGIYPSLAPLGYRNGEVNGKKCIVPDPETALLIKMIFEWYSTSNYSLLEITNKAYEEGLTYRKSKTKVHKSVVAKLLNNPIYYGDFEWNGKIYKGVHAPIISQELFDQVQVVLDRRGKHLIRMQKHHWAFQGLVACGHCGCTMTVEIKKNRYVYYHCTGHKGKCPEKYVREEEIATQFGEELKRLQIDDESIHWLTTILKGTHHDEEVYHSQMVEKLQKEYKQIETRIDQMYIDKLDGKVTIEFFERKSKEWKNEQTEIQRKLQNHERENEPNIDDGIKILELAQKASNLYEKRSMREKATIN